MPTLFQEKYLKLPGPLRLKAKELNTVLIEKSIPAFVGLSWWLR